MSSLQSAAATAANVSSAIGTAPIEASHNPFDGTGPAGRPSTATLSTLIQYALRQHDKMFRVAMPARIEKRHSDYYVDVQPGFSMRYRGEKTAVKMPVIGMVPVLMLQGADYGLHMPVAEGDTGILIVLDRSVNSWLAGNGDAADPNDPRLHNLQDAVFLPGLTVDGATDAAQPLNGNLRLDNGKSHLVLQKNGKVQLGTDGNELVSLVAQLAEEVAAMATLVHYKPTPLDNIISALQKIST